MISEKPKEFEPSNVSNRLLARSLSQKLKKNNHESLMANADSSGGVSLRCLNLYSRGGGGCKVGAATSDEFGEVGFKPVCGTHDTTVDCFSYGVDRFWKRNNRKKKKNLEVEKKNNNNTMDVFFLPDDVLEMCLMRLPLTSLMNSRLVCKKWRALTTTPRFMEMRKDGCFPTPWLFVFGTVKHGYCSREIYGFDVFFKKWHKIEAEILTGRFLFSVTTVCDDIYVIGGRSNGKTHRGVLVFSPLTKLWHKVASMKNPRSKPVLGVCEVNSDLLVVKSQHNHFLRSRARVGGSSDVYEDPHRLSVRRLSFSVNEKVKPASLKDRKRFLILAVGGLGSWEEPLDSCEIYDSLSNKWTEIQRLPADFGVVCSAVVCNGIFYVYSETDKLAAYDIGLGFWVQVQMTPAPPRVHEYAPKLVSCDDRRLFMVSVSWCEGDGEIGRRNKAVRKLWELDLVCLKWNEVSKHPDAPMDWNAGFVADKNLIFGVEMFKIFGQVLEFLTMCDVADPKMKWVHVSKNQVAREMDAASCVMKSMAVVHL